MNSEVAIIRLLHIVPAVVWVGGAIFMNVIVVPVMDKQAPPVRKAVMPGLARGASILLTAAGTLTILAGLVLVARTPGRGYGELFTNGWGWSIGIGLITAVIAMAIGVMTGTAARQLGAVGDQVGPTGPTPEQASLMMKLNARLHMYGRSTLVLTLIATGSMAVARWV